MQRPGGQGEHGALAELETWRGLSGEMGRRLDLKLGRGQWHRSICDFGRSLGLCGGGCLLVWEA